MKRIPVFFLSLCLCGCAAGFPRAVRTASLSFNPETEGLVLVRTVDESDGSVRYSARRVSGTVSAP